jgi:hypothetical protein
MEVEIVYLSQALMVMLILAVEAAGASVGAQVVRV